MLHKGIFRIIDANVNRAKEGLRVCEEITRFILSDKKLSLKLKDARHAIGSISTALASLKDRLDERSSNTDIGKKIFLKTEFKRNGYQDIFLANIQRVKESLRVLEEFAKLKNKQIAADFKKIRYDIYEVEKKVITKFHALRDT